MLVEFVVGDWSDDGHGEYESFLVDSCKPLQDVREAHFASPIDIGSICSKYEEDSISKDMARDIQEKLGINAAEFTDKGMGELVFRADGIIKLWIAILNKIDPSLHLVIIPKPKYPTIHFYGYDDKKRHLQTPGYGVFLS